MVSHQIQLAKENCVLVVINLCHVAMSEGFVPVNTPCNLILQGMSVWVSITTSCNLSWFIVLITGLDQLRSAGLPLMDQEGTFCAM